ncbi:hypothetical protein LADH09A_001034, partial [Micromonospora sp. LAH09]|uniref:hypothetical protein n=1 Tax=Micromonospora cabrerizensis TaxID=2911213 RepID=UPI001EE97DF1
MQLLKRAAGDPVALDPAAGCVTTGSWAPLRLEAVGRPLRGHAHGPPGVERTHSACPPGPTPPATASAS